MSVFSDRLTMLREERGMTQKDVAAEIGVSRTALLYYEHGVRVPDVNTLVMLAKFYRVTADYLIGLTPNRNIENRPIGDSLGLTDDSIEELNEAYTDDLIFINAAIESGALPTFLCNKIVADAAEEWLNSMELDDDHKKAIRIKIAVSRLVADDAFAIMNRYLPNYDEMISYSTHQKEIAAIIKFLPQYSIILNGKAR
jgi:transcriptional regulator with XRE-family HTH domain